jgi:hypothetical protein
MNIKRAPTMNGRRGWNVPHGKRLIAICGRRSDQFNKHWAQGRPKDSGLPVHQAFRIKTSSDVRRLESVMFTLLREIAHYDVRFPESRKSPSRWWERARSGSAPDIRCFGNAELVTRTDPIILQAKLAATPEHFLNVDGIRPSPNLQDLYWSSLVRPRYEDHERTTDLVAVVTQATCLTARWVGESPVPRPADQRRSP